MFLWWILLVFSLMLFCLGIYHPVRYPHSSCGLPRSVIFASWIIAVLLYGLSVYELVGASLAEQLLVVKFFFYAGVILLFALAGWIGFKIANDLNNSDYIKQISHIAKQIDVICSKKAF